jgi:rRNA processing protein Gar1
VQQHEDCGLVVELIGRKQELVLVLLSIKIEFFDKHVGQGTYCKKKVPKSMPLRQTESIRPFHEQG